MDYEQHKRLQYGKANNHYKWDLAKAFFTNTNDNFFIIYGFNWVPKGNLFSEAKQFLSDKERKLNDARNNLWRPALGLENRRR